MSNALGVDCESIIVIVIMVSNKNNLLGQKYENYIIAAIYL